VTEEPSSSTFSLGLAGSIQKNCFEFLDAPVEVLGSENTPAIPLNEILETEYLPNAEKVKKVHDVWKFSKDSRSKNPNWLLIDTQA